MSTLVEVHEVHVHSVPRNLLVELSVEVKERLAEDLHTVDPHLCRRECMHPCDDTDALLVSLSCSHDVSNFL